MTLANDVLILFEPKTVVEVHPVHVIPDAPVVAAQEEMASVASPVPDDIQETEAVVPLPVVPEVPTIPEVPETPEKLVSELPERRVILEGPDSEDSEHETIAPLPSSTSVISKAASALHSITSLRKPNVRTVVFDDDDAKTRISRLTRR